MRLSTNQLSSSSKQSLTSNIHQKTLTSQLTSRPRLSVSVPSSANVINTSINHLPIKTEISTREDDEDSDDIVDNSYHENDQERLDPTDSNLSVLPVNFGVTEGNKGDKF